ncbi:proton-conducting transporter transmembrane domain-containing protein [Rickettsia endosymbiont of Cardiosporidium cionae]|uniref:proton-conducting transporter transmembrane domain-containing protein n=1 Tax=Rickettsia endosymbiont of Cardiosporidium cionae TaxID=2777155 RepID=UPI001894345B|nr:proton-conducting transporter membrane subunit [Rickettsia endosymbiont of Cardiosporidium cionae]KAF8818243.1 cation:proton antiporter [Rickettsia endosymbiont of Cardiosporidium cionae]
MQIYTSLFSLSIILFFSLTLPLFISQHSSYRNKIFIFVVFLYCINILIINYQFLHYQQFSITLIEVFARYKISFHLEVLGIIFLDLLSVLWLISTIYSTKFLEIHSIKNINIFVLFMNFCIVAGNIVALSANLFTMFIGYELLTLATIPLVAYQRGSKKLTKNVFNYLKILQISSLGLFLPAVVIIYTEFGNGDFIKYGIFTAYNTTFSKNFSIILLLMFIFGISKTSIFPMHQWLPDAMVAIYPVSALLHAVVVVKTGLFCMYKILTYIFGLNYLQYLMEHYNYIILLPMIAVIHSSLQALKFNNIKMILAYSTINQLNLGLLAIFILSDQSLFAAIIQMISHAFIKISLFYAMGLIYSVNSAYNVRDLLGISKIMPVTSAVILVSSLGLIGIPPFSGFFSKIYLIRAAIAQKQILAIMIVIISSIISSIYTLKILNMLYRPISNKLTSLVKMKPNFCKLLSDGNDSFIIEKQLPISMLLSIIFCVLVTVFFGFLSPMIKNFILNFY